MCAEAGIQDSAVQYHLGLLIYGSVLAVPRASCGTILAAPRGRLPTFDEMVEEVEALARTAARALPVAAQASSSSSRPRPDGPEAKGNSKSKRRKGLSRKDAEAIYLSQVRATLRRDADERRRQAGLPPLDPGDFEDAPQVSDDEAATASSEEVVTIFKLSGATPSSGHERVCVDSGAARSACPPSYAAGVPVSPATNKLSFQTASGEILEHYGSKTIPYDLGGLGNLGINLSLIHI